MLEFRLFPKVIPELLIPISIIDGNALWIETSNSST